MSSTGSICEGTSSLYRAQIQEVPKHRGGRDLASFPFLPPPLLLSLFLLASARTLPPNPQEGIENRFLPPTFHTPHNCKYCLKSSTKISFSSVTLKNVKQFNHFFKKTLCSYCRWKYQDLCIATSWKTFFPLSNGCVSIFFLFLGRRSLKLALYCIPPSPSLSLLSLSLSTSVSSPPIPPIPPSPHSAFDNVDGGGRLTSVAHN